MTNNHFLTAIGVTEIFSSDPIDRTKRSFSEKKELKASSSFTILEELRKAVESFEGCSLRKTASNLVFSDGNPKAPIMLIGEAPGADEDREGKPFVGMSGQLLTRAFKCAGFDREKDLYISNTVFWRPPGNRQPTQQELDACFPFTQRHIEIINPKVLILVGSTAVKALLKTNEGITKLRGKWLDYTSPGLAQSIPAMAIYHPAYLLRSPSRKKDVWMDVLKIREKLK